mgnify:CR=1 FL=1
MQGSSPSRALLGFHLSGPQASDGRHIIPFYGHTFNKDTWVPDADIAYFNVGGGMGYIPTESWTSSFLGHDDNFGPNYCVPRLYAKPENVEYVVELLPAGYRFDGIAAEAIALQLLYSLDRKLASYKGNPWMRRLAEITDQNVQRVVLRSIAVSRDTYLASLREMNDWDGNSERTRMASILQKLLPDSLWVVEISSPQLFPANERKLGEIVMNPFIAVDPITGSNYDRFLFSRLPEKYLFLNKFDAGRPSFVDFPSGLKSHTPLLRI